MANIKSFVTVSIGFVVEALILFATTRVLTSLLTAKQVGRYALVYAFITMGFSFLIVPASTYVQRKLLQWRSDGTLMAHVRTFFVYICAAGLVTGLAASVMTPLFHIDLPLHWSIICALVCGGVVFMNLSGFFYQALNIFQMRLWYVACSVVTWGGALVMAVVCVLTLSRQAHVWVTGQIMGHVLGALAGALVLIKAVSLWSRHNGVTIKRGGFDYQEFLQFTWPMFAASAILWVQNESYRFLLGWTGGIEMVGLFSVGYNVGSKLCQKFLLLVQNFYHPVFYAQIHSADQTQRLEACRKYANAFVPSIILMGIFVCCVSPYAAVIFVAPAFQAAAGAAIFWAGIAYIFYGVSGIFKMYGISEMNLKVLLGPYAAGAVTVCAFLVVLGGWNPINGAGFALTAGAGISCLFLMHRIRRVIDVPMPWQRIVQALVWSLPLMLFRAVAQRLCIQPDFLQSMLLIAGLCALELLGQVVLAKQWLWAKGV